MLILGNKSWLFREALDLFVKEQLIFLTSDLRICYSFAEWLFPSLPDILVVHFIDWAKSGPH